METIERIVDPTSGSVLAIIVHPGCVEPGIRFVTEDHSTHQIGVLNWRKGHQIEDHIHNPLHRSIDSTQEVLFVRSGRVRVDLYSDDTVYIDSRELAEGDVIFLAAGGHGFEILDDADIVEVKQGPYMGDGEKTRFTPYDNPYREAPHG